MESAREVRCTTHLIILNVVKSFHEGMSAEVRVGTATTDSFEVNNYRSEARLYLGSNSI